MIHIEGLTKSFQDGEEIHEVLGGVDLDIESGDFVALIGRSGSGKSTLLHCLAGIEVADGGSLRVDGVDLRSLDEAGRTRLRRDRIGIVFQFFHLLPSLSVRDNVSLPALLAGDDAAEIRSRADALLDELELLDRAEQFPDRLSGGEQQRVAIARALINRPAILLADEPTGNLDAETAETTLQLFSSIHEKHGVTILMVTHSEEAAAVASRRAELVEGAVEWLAEAESSVDGPAAEDPGTDDGSDPEAPDAELDPDAPKIKIPESGGTEGVRPSAKAAALFGTGPAPAASDDEVDEAAPAEEDLPEEPDPEATPTDDAAEEALDDVVDEALAEDLSEKS